MIKNYDDEAEGVENTYTGDEEVAKGENSALVVCNANEKDRKSLRMAQ